MLQSAATPFSYRRDIDGLRAVAVLSVVAFHAFPEFVRGGFIGVDIFFVISGYLITSIILGHLERGDFNFVEFYQRRIRRIFPALILVLIVCALIGKLILFADEYQQLGKHIAAGAGFASNLLLWSESGYFDTSSETKPLLHLWSLGIEEQFYIVWPLLLWATYRLRMNVIAVIGTIALVSFWLNVRGLHDNLAATFYSPQTRLWELLCGAALAWWATRATVNGPQRPSSSFIGAALICACMLFVSIGAFPGWWALMPTVGAVLIIASGPQSPLNRIVLSNPALVWVGVISYPLYLWHWPLLSFARIIDGGQPGLAVRAALVVLSVMLAWATFRFLEYPIRTIRTKGGAFFKTASLVTAMLIAGFLGYTDANADISQTADAQLVGPWTPWKYENNEACRKRFPMPGADKYTWWFCMLQRDEPPTVILLGNSHTNDFFPGFAQNPEFANDNVLSIGDCGPLWVDKSKLSPETNFHPCSGYRPYDEMVFIDDIIATNKRLRLAVIGSLPAFSAEAFIDTLRRRISFIESNNIQVVVFAPFVGLGYDIRSCYPRRHLAVPRSCETKVENYESIKQNFRSLQEAIHRTNPKTLFWDANFFCSHIKCSFKLDGMPLLRDQHEHLSEYASVRLIQHFSRWAKLNASDLLQNTSH
jgi:peptidoglycan/LPS O-acetylase OafA/YrhL